MPHPVAASVRGSSRRREPSKRPQASEGGRRNFDAKNDTGSGSGQTHAGYEIRTNRALRNIHCSDSQQIHSVAESMAEIQLVKESSSSSDSCSESMAGLELVKKSSSSDSSESVAAIEVVHKSSSPDSSESMAGIETVYKSSSPEEEKKEEEEDSDSSDSWGYTFGEAELAAYEKVRDNRDPYADPASDHSAEEENRLLYERLREEWVRSGKDVELQNLLEQSKNLDCDLCGAKGHACGLCPYLEELPKDVRTLPREYSLMCKACPRIVDNCHLHGDYARCAIRKNCVNCGQMGDHWPEECMKERPWWRLEIEKEEEKKRRERRERRKRAKLESVVLE